MVASDLSWMWKLDDEMEIDMRWWSTANEEGVVVVGSNGETERLTVRVQ